MYVYVYICMCTNVLIYFLYLRTLFYGHLEYEFKVEGRSFVNICVYYQIGTYVRTYIRMYFCKHFAVTKLFNRFM